MIPNNAHGKGKSLVKKVLTTKIERKPAKAPSTRFQVCLQSTLVEESCLGKWVLYRRPWKKSVRVWLREAPDYPASSTRRRFRRLRPQKIPKQLLLPWISLELFR